MVSLFRIFMAIVLSGMLILAYAQLPQDEKIRHIESQDQALLQDICKYQSAFSGNQLTTGKSICLADDNINYLYLPEASNYSSLSITTGYGSGDLSIYTKNNSWPTSDTYDYQSATLGNNECIVVSSPKGYWQYIMIQGEKHGASLVVDLGATSCRTLGNGSQGNKGYPYNFAHIKVFRFSFIDADFSWNNILADLQKAQIYYSAQSYHKFNLTYDLSEPVIVIDQPKATFDDNYHAWREVYSAKIKERGVDINAPGEGNVIMITAPQVGNYNSSAAPPIMELYHYHAGVIAHELGHALGLRHAKALEAGEGRVIGDGNYEKESLNYGNVYSMMGMGAYSMQEYNLLYKKYFNWVSEREVPLVQSSGTYRIYAFDQKTNEHLPLGLRIQSGNKRYTYWLEYRTTNAHYPNTKNGILINLEGYFANEKDKRFWETTSYLLDMTPGSKTPGWWAEDQTDSELQINQTYEDHWGGFRITPIAKGTHPTDKHPWIEVYVEILK
ncbi:pre-peptidase C-terminal domain-containing protein [Fangia hongkongensis]|uniref:pre-peptidase C-terminal domain-containing protein n=1 Tax=Fangia hongkongensis TaxID=270495 RepID=UPI00039DA2FA|nr:pre-peptidase C-terminal domain-containing protein [Fangia hongkongensis]MBK2125638.1 collagenase [Fangia hongkongensis]